MIRRIRLRRLPMVVLVLSVLLFIRGGWTWYRHRWSEGVGELIGYRVDARPPRPRRGEIRIVHLIREEGGRFVPVRHTYPTGPFGGSAGVKRAVAGSFGEEFAFWWKVRDGELVARFQLETSIWDYYLPGILGVGLFWVIFTLDFFFLGRRGEGRGRPDPARDAAGDEDPGVGTGV